MGSRAWIFTINNPQEGCLKTNDKVRYCVFQGERGEQGTYHWQGYIELTCTQRLAAMKEIAPTAHWERRRGTREQARSYAMKAESRQDGPYEFGTWDAGGQGARNDIRGMYEDMKQGSNLRQIVEQHTIEAFKYHGAVSKYFGLFEKKRDWEMEIHVIYGDPGMGKTRKVWDLIKDKDYYIKEPSNKWWDGYDGQEYVLIDDYTGQFEYTYLLRLLDRYPMSLEIKGGSRQLLAKAIYITSNIHPMDWYLYQNYQALNRRFTSVSRCIEVAGVILDPAYDNLKIDYSKFDCFADD